MAALANAGLSTALQRRPRPIAPGTQLIAGTWAIATLWLMPEASPHQIERITVTLIMVVFVWEHFSADLQALPRYSRSIGR